MKNYLWESEGIDVEWGILKKWNFEVLSYNKTIADAWCYDDKGEQGDSIKVESIFSKDWRHVGVKIVEGELIYNNHF